MIVGIGLDLVEVARVRALLASKGDRVRRRLFTSRECEYCETHPVRERHYAARLAAKEASFKALSGTEVAQGIGWRDIEIHLDDLGRPEIVLHGRASDRARELGVGRILVSLTHAATVAAAVVVLEASK